MRTHKNARPHLESLESLALLSGPGADLHAAVHAHARPAFIFTPAPLMGTINGTYVGIENSPQSSATYRFYGVGHVSPVGPAGINGRVQLSNLITTNAGTTATVTLNGTNDLYLHGRRGTLVLQVAPAAINTASSAQVATTYSVTTATGAYHDEVGQTGTMTVSLRSYLPSFVHISRVDVGHFRLTFSTETV